MANIEFQVSGMSCGHCEASVRRAVAGVDGVHSLEVSAASGRLVVSTAGNAADAEIIAAVDEAGYEAVRVP